MKTDSLLALQLPDGRTVEVERGTTIAEIVEGERLKCRTPALAAFVDNRIVRLTSRLERGGRLRLVEHHSIDGMAIYERSVVCLLQSALRRNFPAMRLYVNHSIDNCLYCEMHMQLGGVRQLVTPKKSDLGRVESTMREMVEQNLPFEAVEYDLAEALAVFEAQGEMDKVELLSYRKTPKLHLYRIGDFLAHFYGFLAPSTGALTHFRLKAYHEGFLLQLPKMTDVEHKLPHLDFPELYQQYTKYEEWVNRLGVPHVAALNRSIVQGRVQDLILTVEALHEKRYAKAADKIRRAAELPRVICLAGPSSSGKTTSAKRLQIQLRVNGIECCPLSLDDYFVDREATPRDADGNYDYEAFEAIDTLRINQDVTKLIAGDCVRLPKFDFKKGRSAPGEDLTLAPNQVLLIEGIHGLNPGLLASIPDSLKFNIYVSPVTALNLDNTNRIRSSDVRVLRRMVRDHQFRGYSAEETLGRWPSVRAGEERHIFPFQDNAHFILNTSLLYEVGVLKDMAEPLLAAIGPDSANYSEARRLLNLLSYFESIPREFVPTTSILREFVGESVFSY